MTTYRPIDSKREEFRKYLERAGVMDALTKVLVCLYEEAEKPEDALDYVRKHLGDNRPDMAEFEALQAQVEELRAKNQDLEDEVAGLKERLLQYEPPEPAGDEPPPEGEGEGEPPVPEGEEPPPEEA